MKNASEISRTCQNFPRPTFFVVPFATPYIVDEGDCYSKCQFLEGENTKKEFWKEKGESYVINIGMVKQFF